MKKTLNENGKNIGLKINAYKQGNGWIASITNDSMDHWIEKTLHYSVRTRKDVLEWAEEWMAERYGMEGVEEPRCELTIE